MTACAEAGGQRQWRLGLRLGSAALLILLVTSCDSSPLRSRTFNLGHASFEDAVENMPQLGQISAAFDRNVVPVPSPGERLRQLDLFAEVFDITAQDYVDPVPTDRIVALAVNSFDETAREIAEIKAEKPSEERAPVPEDALSAPKLMASALGRFLNELDAHSDYMPPDLYREMKVRTRGEFGGIGIEVTMEEGLVKVVAPIDGTPGARAGLQTGDLITHVNGEPVLGLTLAEAVKRMRGRRGSSVVLKMRRPPSEEPFQVTIIRDVVRIQAVRARVEGNVGYVRITTFNERAEEALYEAMDDLRDELNEDMLGVVLDLRNNPGGLLDQALAVSDAFLGEGEIVSTRSRDVSRVRRFTAERGDISEGKPVVVLINGGSASASEIVAGALQDHDRALIMGNRSFGKGSVQTIIPVSGGGALRLTTARYYTPDGRSIQRTGIRPDIRAESGDDARRREADLENALEGGVETAAVVQRNMAEVCPNLLEDAEDPTLTCALDILESRRIFAGRLQE